MRLVIDLQCLQTESRYRGIGRYMLSLVQALLARGEGIDCWFLLNDQDPEGAEYARDFLRNRVNARKILSLAIPGPIDAVDGDCAWRMRAAELVRESFIEALAPDVVLTGSLFEFDAITSIPAAARSHVEAAIIYDLIPLSDPRRYLHKRSVEKWYERKLNWLRNADIGLAISDHTREEAVTRLNLDPRRCETISGAADLLNRFADAEPDPDPAGGSSAERGCVLYVGGFDPRKNLDKLIQAYAGLTATLRRAHPLVIAGKIGDRTRASLGRMAARHGLKVDREIRFLGYVPDRRLVELYRACGLFVFPSSDEGFGLPPLEAMSHGAAVIAAGRASLREVVGEPQALFDPDDIAAFSALMARALTDKDFRGLLLRNGEKQAAAFSWEKTAERTLDALRRASAAREGKIAVVQRGFDTAVLVRAIGDIATDDPPADEDLKKVAASISSNARLLDQLKEWDRGVASRRGRTFLEPGGFEDLPEFDRDVPPRVFSSTLCRAQHFRMPLYSYWCRALGEAPRFHRKQWEFVFICQSLFEREQLVPGKRAIGFGVGREPLASLFASRGVSVLATDLDVERARRLGWVSTRQHGDEGGALNERGLCPPEAFSRLVSFRSVDMNRIPGDVGRFDFCWSSCAFEHLGSIRNGLDFVKHSVRLLNPGGVAVHTTEFNLTSNDRTLDNSESLVIFRRRDIDQLASELAREGCLVEPIDYSPGSDRLERYVDLPPYQEDPHLRLQLADEYVSTSIGLIISKPL